MIDSKKLEEELKQFSGSQVLYFQKWLWIDMRYTEGIKFLCEFGNGSYWLLFSIFSYQSDSLETDQEFQVWKFFKDGDSWKLIAEDGNKRQLFGEEIPFSDFLLDSITLYYSNGILYLPSEH